MSQIKINENAPVIRSAEIDITAPIEKVWGILTDFENWSNWNKSVTKMEIEGKIKVGTTFKWTANGSKLVSTIEELDPPKRIIWSGKTLGIKGLHIWEFKNLNGRTHVFTQESFDGLLVKLFKKLFTKILDKSLIQVLSDLRFIAESK
jgi:hypothetical protein